MRFKTEMVMEFLKERDMGRTMFCVRCHVSPHRMKKILDLNDKSRGRKGLILENAWKLAFVMEIDVSNLFDGEID